MPGLSPMMDRIFPALASARRPADLGQCLLQAVCSLISGRGRGRPRVHADRLADQVGDHGEEAHVGVQAEVELVVPGPVDGQSALASSPL